MIRIRCILGMHRYTGVRASEYNKYKRTVTCHYTKECQCCGHIKELGTYRYDGMTKTPKDSWEYIWEIDAKEMQRFGTYL